MLTSGIRFYERINSNSHHGSDTRSRISISNGTRQIKLVVMIYRFTSHMRPIFLIPNRISEYLLHILTSVSDMTMVLDPTEGYGDLIVLD